MVMAMTSFAATPAARSACGPTAIALLLSSGRAFAGSTGVLRAPATSGKTPAPDADKQRMQDALEQTRAIRERSAEDEERDRKKAEDEQQAEDDANSKGGHNAGYLPFPEPFHTVNIMAVLLLGNIIVYTVMYFSSDATRDFMIDHFTLSHDNWWKVYPLLTHSFYQENLFQLVIDSWLLCQFGRTQLGFLGNTRLTFFWVLCQLGGAAIHITRQKFMINAADMDPIEVRGRVYGPNPFILGLVGLEGLIFRNMNFLQNPPVPFLVLTAGVMIIDVWRIFNMKPEEHGASTGGALVAYIMWALPTRMLGLDKLTAAM